MAPRGAKYDHCIVLEIAVPRRSCRYENSPGGVGLSLAPVPFRLYSSRAKSTAASRDLGCDL